MLGKLRGIGTHRSVRDGVEIEYENVPRILNGKNQQLTQAIF